MSVWIYRSAHYDCPINRLYGKTDAIIVDPSLPKLFDSSEDRPALRIVRRNIGGSEYIHAEPIQPPSDGCFYCFGGTYVETSDSRLRAISKYPIPVHDRNESYEYANSLD